MKEVKYEIEYIKFVGRYDLLMIIHFIYQDNGLEYEIMGKGYSCMVN